MSVQESSAKPSAFGALGIDPLIVAAIEARGYDAPTAVQTAVLAPELAGRDVVVSSRTGSGKTLAFALMLAPELAAQVRAERGGTCTPRAVVVVPTRELAQQVREELAWSLAPLGVRVLAVTGGTSVAGEVRALAQGADVVVGTPGRLNDHLTRGAVDPRAVTTIVLDEADEMLDLGFREELEAILGAMPSKRRTVMLSATMPSAIAALAARYMRDPVRLALEGPGAANADIAHVAHLVRTSDKLDALVNVLLTAHEERAMVFARTRADAAATASKLAEFGFAAAALTGEMAQRERTQTLDAFRAGRVTVLVATDVAARGIDVPEVSRVIHADLPGDAAALTHRSGRTGRAGRKGTSVLLVPPYARGRANELLRGAGVHAVWRPLPTPAEIRAAAEERLRARLAEIPHEKTESSTPSLPDAARLEALAASLLEEIESVRLVARLLAELPWSGPCEARALRPMETERTARPSRAFEPAAPAPFGARFSREERKGRGGTELPRAAHGEHDQVIFRVNFGERHGATPARLLAMVCRRGGIRGADVGAIRIGDEGSTFGVTSAVARAFAAAAARTDAREPHVRIEPVYSAQGPREALVPRDAAGPRTRSPGAPGAPRRAARPSARASR